MSKLILLSGPSCVGKGPLITALGRFYPHVMRKWKKLVLYNSRVPRPGEQDGVDYHFRNRQVIEEFRGKEQFLVVEIRGDLQAMDLEQLRKDLQSGEIFFEGNPFLVEELFKHSDIREVPRLSVFLSPLSKEEILYLKSQSEQVDLGELVTEVMRRKLLRRSKRQKTNLSRADLEDIERRAGRAWREMGYARRYDYVIANHDGEDSENWDGFYFPLGDARRALECFAAIVQGQTHPGAETWASDMISDSDSEHKWA